MSEHEPLSALDGGRHPTLEGKAVTLHPTDPAKLVPGPDYLCSLRRATFLTHLVVRGSMLWGAGEIESPRQATFKKRDSSDRSPVCGHRGDSMLQTSPAHLFRERDAWKGFLFAGIPLNLSRWAPLNP